MNQRKRAHAGSSQRLADNGVSTAIIMALSDRRKSFSDLLSEIADTSQSVLASNLVELSSDGWIFRNPHNGAYGLTNRGADMLDRAAAAKRRDGRQARRAGSYTTNPNINL
jgi:DNA-binding HxlR family transcriptional regulator